MGLTYLLCKDDIRLTTALSLVLALSPSELHSSLKVVLFQCLCVWSKAEHETDSKCPFSKKEHNFPGVMS